MSYDETLAILWDVQEHDVLLKILPLYRGAIWGSVVADTPAETWRITRVFASYLLDNYPVFQQNNRNVDSLGQHITYFDDCTAGLIQPVQKDSNYHGKLPKESRMDVKNPCGQHDENYHHWRNWLKSLEVMSALCE